MLFATLDPTMRGVRLESGPEIILSDTVGFISDLPTELVAAFRATLEEVLDADLICHVRDISHPETEEQAADVAAILRGLGVAETAPMIEVWNKIDKLDPEAKEGFAQRAAREENIFALSAVSGEGMQALLGAAEMADAQQLERPLIHRIEAIAGDRLGLAAEAQRRERLHAHPLTAETIGAQLVARLQEGQGHPLRLLTGAVDAGHALQHLQAGAAGPQGGIKQHALAGRHAHRREGVVGQEAEAHQNRRGEGPARRREDRRGAFCE